MSNSSLTHLHPEVALLLAAWLDHLAHERDAAARTVQAYGGDLRTFLAFLAEHRGEPPTAANLVDLPLVEFRAWLAALQHKGMARSSINRAAAAVRGFYRFVARTQGGSNTALLTLRTPRLKRSLPRPLAVEDTGRLTAAADGPDWIGHRDAALLTLLYGAGLRIGEALGLDRRALADDAAATSSLIVTGKGRRQRMVPVLPVVARALAAYIKPAPLHSLQDRPCSAALAASVCSKASFRRGCVICAERWACLRRQRLTPCGTASLPICSATAPTYARSRSCSVTPACPRPRAIPASTPSACARCTLVRIRAPDRLPHRGNRHSAAQKQKAFIRLRTELTAVEF